MNFKEHFIKIKHFLGPFENIWSHEVINFYPKSMNYYKDEWSAQLKGLSDVQRWALDSRDGNNSLEKGELLRMVCK